MPLKGEQGILPAHPRSVVNQLDERFAPLLDHKRQRSGTRVDRIFEKFFHCRRGALDDFSGGDLVGEILWKYVYGLRHRSFFSERNSRLLAPPPGRDVH